MTSRMHIFGVLVLAALTALVSVGCGGDDGGVQVQTGWELFESGDYQGALAVFQDDVQADSTDISARSGIAWCELSLDDLDAARLEFSALLALDPQPMNAAAGMAYALSASRKYREAVRWVDVVLENRPDYAFPHAKGVNEDGLHLLGARCLYLLNKYEDSYRYLSQVAGARQLDPRADDFVERLIAEITRLER